VFGTYLLNLSAIDPTLLLITFTRSKCAFSGKFDMETVLSGKKSFSWPGKIVICIMHIVPCKMIIGLILYGLFDNEVFESTLLLLVLVGVCNGA
jgi:hypothetical protein